MLKATKYNNLKKSKSLNDLQNIVHVIDDDNWSLSYYFE